jgi:ankyrin repeat protein
LVRAAGEGRIEDILILIAIGTDVSGRDQLDGGRTPLHRAALSDHVLALELLLQNNASLEAVDNDGHTPLEVAITAKADKVVARFSRRA